MTAPVPKWACGFAKVPSWIALDERLSDGEFRTLVYVLSRIWRKSFALSVTEIARHRRMEERNIRRHLSRLIELGYLTRDAKPGVSARFARGAATLEPPVTPVTSDRGVSGEPRSPATAPPVTSDRGTPVTSDRDQKTTRETEGLSLVDEEKKKTSEAAARAAGVGSPSSRSAGARKRAASRRRTKTGTESESEQPIADRVIGFYERTFDRSLSQATRAKCARAIAGRISEGRSVDELELAVRGLHASEWHRANGRDGLIYAVRDDDAVRAMVAQTRAPARRGRAAAAAASADEWAPYTELAEEWAGAAADGGGDG